MLKNMLREDNNITAIVGGQTTLKKKIHISLIAYSLDKILKLIGSKKYNLLTINVSYE
jgi:hypothetical protein